MLENFNIVSWIEIGLLGSPGSDGLRLSILLAINLDHRDLTKLEESSLLLLVILFWSQSDILELDATNYEAQPDHFSSAWSVEVVKLNAFGFVLHDG